MDIHELRVHAWAGARALAFRADELRAHAGHGVRPGGALPDGLRADARTLATRLLALVSEIERNGAQLGDELWTAVSCVGGVRALLDAVDDGTSAADAVAPLTLGRELAEQAAAALEATMGLPTTEEVWRRYYPNDSGKLATLDAFLGSPSRAPWATLEAVTRHCHALTTQAPTPEATCRLLGEIDMLRPQLTALWRVSYDLTRGDANIDDAVKRALVGVMSSRTLMLFVLNPAAPVRQQAVVRAHERLAAATRDVNSARDLAGEHEATLADAGRANR